jgi:uncharacterized protein YbaA (DUF1428 family)
MSAVLGAEYRFINLTFDGKRMIWGGFKEIVSL